MNTIKGKIIPLKDKVLVSHMEFGTERTAGGLFLLADDGKSSGIHPRWAKVFAVGLEQEDVAVGDWVLLTHGRWSRGIKYENENGEQIDIRLADKDAILLVSDEKPTDAMRVVIGALNMEVPNA
jgi:co-chaperonin GroES (HSP10)